MEAFYCKNEDLARTNILHICAKRQVSKSLFKEILRKLNDVTIFQELMLSPDNEDNLPLHLAARCTSPVSSNQGMVKTQDTDANVVLYVTSNANDDEPSICEQLLARLIEISTACISSSDERIRSLVLDVLSTKNRLGKTPIHEASQEKYPGNLKLMWQALSSVDKQNREKGFFMYDDKRFTCVHLAAKNGSHEGRQFTYCI